MVSLMAGEIELLRKVLTPVDYAPALRRVNGFGFGLYGRLYQPELHPLRFKMYFFTAVWIPIIPVCVYLVEIRRGIAFRFYRKLTLQEFHTIYRGRLIRFYMTVLGESIFLLVMVAVVLTVAILAVTALCYAFK